eukprot:1137191-Pelagomonas_calceolata.AAC.5
MGVMCKEADRGKPPSEQTEKIKERWKTAQEGAMPQWHPATGHRLWPGPLGLALLPRYIHHQLKHSLLEEGVPCKSATQGVLLLKNSAPRLNVVAMLADMLAVMP